MSANNCRAAYHRWLVEYVCEPSMHQFGVRVKLLLSAPHFQIMGSYEKELRSVNNENHWYPRWP
jgi:hypothetical protein